jgi:predicted  nucleic acid-binding Zn-ribbon protein
MIEPEISHRCQKCGAAFRKGAQFCPQCGTKDIRSESNATLENEASMQDTMDLAGAKRTRRGSNAPTQPFKPEVRDLPFAGNQPSENKVNSELETDKRVPSTKVFVAPNEGTSKRHRVRDAALGMVTENVRPRVEKIRQASSVVLEEATALDPSVRFVLIALFLFVVFLLLLGLSFIR